MTDQDKSISDGVMANLPDDDKLAFVTYEERLRPLTRGGGPENQGSSLEREYSNHILAFIKIANLDIPVSGTPPYDDSNFWEWYHRFVQVIDYHIVEYRLAHARGTEAGITTAVHLSVNYKTQIHKLLDKIRKVVNAVDLADTKKNAIYDKIAALQSEVDRTKTRFDTFLSRWLDITNAAGEGAENLEPVVKLLDRVIKIFGRAKADHDAGKLPAPEETRKLPGPKPQELVSADLDEEIPF